MGRRYVVDLRENRGAWLVKEWKRDEVGEVTEEHIIMGTPPSNHTSTSPRLGSRSGMCCCGEEQA